MACRADAWLRELQSGCFGDDYRGRAEQAFAQFVAFAQLLQHVALGDLARLLLRHRFVQVRIKRPARWH